MPYKNNAALPDGVKRVLPSEGQAVWRNVYNSQEEKGLSTERCASSAWSALKNQGWVKGTGDDGKWHKVKKVHEGEVVTRTFEVPITKINQAQQRVWGWASIAVTKAGEPIIDTQGDVIDIEDLEEAFYDYFKVSGDLNFMHEGPSRGRLIEMLITTPEKLGIIGIADGTVPLGAFVGYEIPDKDDFAKVTVDGLMMFSIEGTAIREAVE